MTRWIKTILEVCLVVIVSVTIVRAQDVTLPYTETFDGATAGTSTPGTLPDDWLQVSEGGSTSCGHGNEDCWEWGVRSGTTPSSNTGPLADHTTGDGNYVYVEASGNTNTTVELLSPSFNLNGDTDAELRFWSHSYNGNGSTSHDLIVDVVNEANTSTLGTALLTIADTDFNNWRQYTVDLSAYASSGNIKIKFRWEEDDASWQLDHCIDDFTITSDYCTTGDNYRDEFASANYNNSNGSINWSSDSWSESDDNNNASTGEIRITGESWR